LVNDPDPPSERIEQVLGRYPFEDVQAAYENLMALATEKIRFLSTRRCRHFLAAIAPRLLAAIAATPEPDTTLVNLSRVSDSLGGKAALWELFSSNRPSLNLYVTLCAACPYLAGILTSNPGMIDELMDSLLVEHLPTLSMLEQTLAELSRGAEDLDPILHSFKNAQHLRVGVRDVLGKDDIRSTHAALSDVAEACLKQIAASEYAKLVDKFGEPTILIPSESEPPTPDALQQWQRFADRKGDVREPVVLALGKLGGREPNYHSDLDLIYLIFLYEAGGNTLGRQRGTHSSTTNGHFFSEFGQRVIRMMSHLGPHGRLYEVDARLRPTGKSGLLAVGRRSAKREWCSARRPLPNTRCKPSPTPPLDRHGRPSTRRKSARCGCGSRKPLRSATSSAARAARSTSSFWCRCYSSNSAAPILRSAVPARSKRSTRCERAATCRTMTPTISAAATASSGASRPASG
jgi:glutamate-ammonia-ligase adenylyltransferase